GRTGPGPRTPTPTRREAEAHVMETGHTTSTSAQSFPRVKHLVWALVVGAALVISGMRDDGPPQPSATGTAAPAPAPPAAPAAPTPDPTRPAQALAYLAPERPAPEPLSYMRHPSVLPAPLPRSPVRPAPLRALPAGPAPASAVVHGRSGPVSASPAPSRSGSTRLPSVKPLPPSTPLRLRIPALKVDAPMMKLALNAAGALEPPPDNNPVLTGWYAGGTVPGAVGTAVTAGHVDTSVGPGAFHQLGSVRKGATVEIARADGRTAVFTVYAVEVYNKKNFPDRKVYGPSARPELRVITCGGDYDKKTGYEDNVVVFAAMTASR
ncbi:class F sortase, partial [Streptomyces sp. NPDC060209]|uniref:class F sortase n=1 Tax=Streptomyces sp. NPDC060209 TaxID=3347073 RepID=UPI0036668561